MDTGYTLSTAGSSSEDGPLLPRPIDNDSTDESSPDDGSDSDFEAVFTREDTCYSPRLAFNNGERGHENDGIDAVRQLCRAIRFDNHSCSRGSSPSPWLQRENYLSVAK